MPNRDNLELIARYSKDHLKQSVGSQALSDNFILYVIAAAVIALLAFWGAPDTWHVANVVLWSVVAFGCVMRLASLFFVPFKRGIENDNGTAGGEVFLYLAYVCVFKADRVFAKVFMVVAFLLGGHFGKAIVLSVVCTVHMLVAYFYWRKSYPAALAAARKATGATV
ncbi:MAG: hypothetical protein VX154_06465 [Pseudomonadota bacterium]|nr:hypothetical protein [Pseudomonadota bacterium]